MIAEARRHYPALAFEVADARHLGYQARFDAVFSNATLHWVQDAEPAADAVAQALKPGGRFVAEFGGRGNIQFLLAAVQAACKQVLGTAVEPPWYFPSIGEYAGDRRQKRRAQKCGFAKISGKVNSSSPAGPERISFRHK
jgi:trans-aconitate 2-methyltransferase